jgi:glycosyltransferase involved in cell wall biosynthesis
VNILYVTGELPWPLTSGYLRHYHFIKSLSQRHRVSLMSLTERPGNEADARRELGKYCDVIEVFSFQSANKPIYGRLTSEMRRRKQIRRLGAALLSNTEAGKFDLVFVSTKECAALAIRRLTGFPVIVDCCDASYKRLRMQLRYVPLMQQPLALCRFLRVVYIERYLMQRANLVLFGSERDRQAVFGHSSRGSVVPQGVDTTYWKRTSAPLGRAIVFTGAMDYQPNADAALYLVRNIIPKIQQCIPEMECFIAGRDPRTELIEAAARCRNVTVTGSVPDIRPYLERASLFVAPLRFASGVQNKILEAMAMETPVLTTAVAADGCVSGEHAPPLRVCSDAQSFAEAAIHLLRDQQERGQLAKQGRSFVEQHFDWEIPLSKLNDLCIAAVSTRHRAAAVGTVSPQRS